MYRATGCTKGIKVPFCHHYGVYLTSTTPYCLYCQNGFVLVYDGSYCHESVADSIANCSRLEDASLTKCLECWDGFVFDGVVCVGLGRLVVGGMGLLVIFGFMV